MWSKLCARGKDARTTSNTSDAVLIDRKIYGQPTNRLLALSDVQDKVLAELFAVMMAEGIGAIDAPDLTRQIKAHSRSKFSRPSMMQASEPPHR